MLYRQEQQMLAVAIAFAACKHSETRHFTRTGEAYITHPLRVMLAIPKDNAAARIVAVLHDVLEDTDCTLEQLRDSLGLPEFILEALSSVTKQEGETYMQFRARSKANPIGRRVAIADIQDNMSRLGELSKNEQEFLKERYTRALALLQQDQQPEEDPATVTAGAGAGQGEGGREEHAGS